MRLEVDDRNSTMITDIIVVKELHLVCSDACLLLQQPRVDVRRGNNIMSRDFVLLQKYLRCNLPPFHTAIRYTQLAGDFACIDEYD